MAISMPIWLVVSQWVLLFALGFLVMVMYRQFGLVMQAKDHGTDRDGLLIGDQAPSFEYVAKGLARTRFEPKRDCWSLLLFADPGCSSCSIAVQALESLPFSQNTRALIVTSADEAQLNAIEAFRNTLLDIARVSYDVSNKLYRIHATPFAYLISPEGVVHAKGLATDQVALRKIWGNVSGVPAEQEPLSYADNVRS